MVIAHARRSGTCVTAASGFPWSSMDHAIGSTVTVVPWMVVTTGRPVSLSKSVTVPSVPFAKRPCGLFRVNMTDAPSFKESFSGERQLRTSDSMRCFGPVLRMA
jgi:hypothetical protein